MSPCVARLSLLLALVGCAPEGAPDDKPGDSDPGSDLDTSTDADGDGVTAEDDCDDADADAFPGNPERCDGLDNDCDGEIDDAAVDGATWHADEDGDGYGGTTTVAACDVPAGYVADDTDCDDGDADAFPGNPERCDGVDNDCNGEIDDDAADPATWYADADGDGYGDPTVSTAACDAPSGFVEDDTDCDDAATGTNPGATEICDADDADEDCDGVADDPAAEGASSWYADADLDGYGGAVAATACDQPVGFVATSTDCDDADDAIHPGAVEICDEADTDEDCDGSSDDASAVGQATWHLDADGDGYGGATTLAACDAPAGYLADDSDCDDADADAFPGNPERCDGVDEDCNGVIDDAAVDPSTWYADTDGDGYGDPTVSTAACDAPSGFVADYTDCDDAATGTNPGATEVCDADDVDEDCDGVADDPAADGASSWYADTDLDGYGGRVATTACDQPVDSLATSTDCDDTDDTIHPGAVEVCDAANTDEDCDGLSDDASAAGRTPWYRDTDGDGYGGVTTVSACDAPSGYVANDTDCDDAMASVHPGGIELCDAANTDEDCDGLTDDADPTVTGGTSWYVDADGDGYGDTSGAATVACDAPAGHVATHTDCDDDVASINPAARETCDSANTDEDCDGLADDSDVGPTGTSTWYRDADSDGYGSSSATRSACDQPTGYVAIATDCNDASASISPGDPEVCDSANTDEDCDGSADDADSSATGATTWYRDADVDGYGTTTTTTSACDRPTGYVSTSTDCNDASASISPGDPEVCDSANTDEDCDGNADDNDTAATGRSTWYRDADADGYGVTTSTTSACDLPSGYSSLSTDCDDTDADVSPAAVEVCDSANTDEDCDRLADDLDSSVTGETTWHRDADRDGYGSETTTYDACDRPSGYVADDTDCNDGSSAISPADSEICDASNTDEDCDGLSDNDDTVTSGTTTYYLDADGDGYGSTTSVSECDRPTGYVTNSSDCDDTDASTTTSRTWYRDLDSDGYGSTTTSRACTAPSGYVATGGDCDDTSATENPGEDEVCDAANVDEDCNGTADNADSGVTDQITFYRDADSDGYGASATTRVSCDQPSGYVTNGSDCDDTTATISPADTEVCDGADTDEDCDGLADDDDSAVTGRTTWYRDADSDGYGGTLSTTACDSPSGYVSAGSDCDDTETLVNPGEAEVCEDGVDQDCDGLDDACPVLIYAGDYLVDDASVYYARIDGERASDFLGYVLTAGDFDGDGQGDIATGASGGGYGAYNYGVAYSWFGPFTAGDQNATDHDDVLYYSTASARSSLGSDVSNIGDLNGDGMDDLAISGASTYWITYGGDTGVKAFTSSVYDGSVSASYGTRPDRGGTVDGSTVGSGWVTSNSASGGNAGVTYVHSGLTAGTVAQLTGEAAGDVSGGSFASGEDVDGDGVDDLVIGAYSNDYGAAYVVYGPVSGTFSLALADAKLKGSASDYYTLGLSVGLAEDLDADGYADVVASAYTSLGTAQSCFLIASGPQAAVGYYADALTAAVCSSSTDWYSREEPEFGDLNGDGVTDLIGGATGMAYAGDYGGVAIQYGPFSGTIDLGTDLDVAIYSDGLGGSFTTAFGAEDTYVVVPDADGDGDDELVISAPVADPSGRSSAGSLFIWSGQQ